MDGKLDRRLIEPLLKKHFPEMVGESSDAWHLFLNAETGLAIALDEQNASAFDKWRQALDAKGLPVWGMSETRRKAIDERVAAMQDAEKKRQGREAEKLAELKAEAPHIKAKDLLK